MRHLGEMRVPGARTGNRRHRRTGNPRQKVKRVNRDVVERAAVRVRLEIPTGARAKIERMLAAKRNRAHLADFAISNDLVKRAKIGVIMHVELATDAQLFLRAQLFDALQFV